MHEDVVRVELRDRLGERHRRAGAGGRRSSVALAGSSRTSWTAAAWCSHAATGSSSTEGPGVSLMSEPPARNPGNHSTRWRTTSRARQSATGLCASQPSAATPRTRSANRPAIARCSSAGSVGIMRRPRTEPGQHLVERGVALVDADLHAAGHHPGLRLHRLDDRQDLQPGAAVAEVVQHEGLEGDRLGHLLEAEGLHDLLVLPDPVDRAVEVRDLLAVAERGVAVLAAGPHVPDLDVHVDRPRAHPLLDELGLDVGAVDELRRGVELAGDPHDGDVGVCLDDGLGSGLGGGHPAAPSVGCVSLVVLLAALQPVEECVQSLVALLRLLAVPLDPFRHQVEDLRVQVHRAPLGVPASADAGRPPRAPGCASRPPAARRRTAPPARSPSRRRPPAGRPCRAGSGRRARRRPATAGPRVQPCG